MEQVEEKTYTPEEIKSLKETMIQKWEAEIPFLAKQAEYERLITELEELQMRRIFAQVKTANLVAEAPKPEDPELKTEKRTLKKV